MKRLIDFLCKIVGHNIIYDSRVDGILKNGFLYDGVEYYIHCSRCHKKGKTIFNMPIE